MSDTSNKPTANGIFVLNDVRLSFPHLYTPHAGYEGMEPKYSANFLIPKDRVEQIAAVKAAMKEAAERANLSPEQMKKITRDRVALKDGDDKDYDGFQAQMYVSASSKDRPRVVDRGQRDVPREAGLVYAGCYVNAVLRFWAQNNKFGVRINCELKAVQFWAHGDAFGAGAVDLASVLPNLEGDGGDSLFG